MDRPQVLRRRDGVVTRVTPSKPLVGYHDIYWDEPAKHDTVNTEPLLKSRDGIRRTLNPKQ